MVSLIERFGTSFFFPSYVFHFILGENSSVVPSNVSSDPALDSSSTDPATSSDADPSVQAVPPPTCLGKRKRNAEKDAKPNMNLYLHNMVAHIPDCFESMDFKNCNTERFEGFLAFMKTVFNNSTNRNPSLPQVVLQVFIRHHFRGVSTGYKGKYFHPLYSKIAKHFSEHHSMKELTIERTLENGHEVDALVKTLKEREYSQFHISDGSILFDTLEAAEELQSGMTPELASLRVDIAERYDDPCAGEWDEQHDDSQDEHSDESCDERSDDSFESEEWEDESDCDMYSVTDAFIY